MIRSYLFVPADSERKLAKGLATAADALILDLEDSVAASERPRARQLAREFLAAEPNAAAELWVRINPLNTADALADLRAVMPASPAGIVLPKPDSARDAVQLGKLLDALEQENGITAGRTKILPIATETPAALFQLQSYALATERLAGLTWGAEDLSTAVGAVTNRDAVGNWLPPYELARSLCLFAAAAAGVSAIDTVFADFRDGEGVRQYANNARRDGFAGMLAIHPAQVDIINAAFAPGDEELARAKRIVDLFRQHPGAGVLGMDGEMLDRPHLLQAEKIVERAKAKGREDSDE